MNWLVFGLIFAVGTIYVGLLYAAICLGVWAGESRKRGLLFLLYVAVAVAVWAGIAINL